MAKKPAVSRLNASTIDILNVIRANASQQYQDKIPEVTKTNDIPVVGDILMGYPGLANEFVSALMNRIAYVAIKSSTFNNPYVNLKKGYLLTGEMVEDIFISIAKVYSFHNDTPVEKLELGKEEPDAKSSFYATNWKTQYKCSISDEQIRSAFVSMEGVQDLINRIIEQIYVAAEYDEWLLTKYLIIKSVVKAYFYTVNVGDANDTASAAKAFRGYSNLSTFPSTRFNESHVLNNVPRERQAIFMDSLYNAQFDVDQLASAFNMDKTTFFGQLYLMDDWTTFDNDRWAEIRAQGAQVEEVTDAELEIMKHVKAVIVDTEWFQIYDKLLQMSNTYVASKLTWNYFLTSFKIVAHSPFANAIVFVDDGQVITLPENITATVVANETSGIGNVVTLEIQDPTGTINSGFPEFVQTEDAIEKSVAVHKYGVYIFPPTADSVTPQITAGGKTYMASAPLSKTAEVGSTVTLS